ncbi:hypothetical protein WJX77_008038 [Trebouxia sp. C0004]
MPLSAEDARYRVLGCVDLNDNQKAELLLLINSEPNKTVPIFTGVPDSLLALTLTKHLEGLTAGGIITQDPSGTICQSLMGPPISSYPTSLQELSDCLSPRAGQHVVKDSDASAQLITAISGLTRAAPHVAGNEGLTLQSVGQYTTLLSVLDSMQTRPDLVITAAMLTVMLCEYKKAADGVQGAYQDLVNKCTGALPPGHYGAASFIPAICASGHAVEFCAVGMDGQVYGVPQAKFSTQTRPERIRLILAMANVYQLLALIVSCVKMGLPPLRAWHICCGTYPVGYSHNPAEEQDVQLLAYSVCRALYILWKAKLVHRDVRMANIVRLQGPEDHYMLLDLGNVAQVKIWPAVQPFKDWDSFTLSKNSEYDHLSDMYQLGKLLKRLLRRTGSQAAEEFINSIRNKSLTAEQALKHVWLMRQ